MNSPLRRHTDNRIFNLLVETVSHGMNYGEIRLPIKAIENWKEHISLSLSKGPRIFPFSLGDLNDKLSLVVVPLAASAGIVVPKLLTPFTVFNNVEHHHLNSLAKEDSLLVKLQSIPEFQTSLSLKEINKQLLEKGAVFFSPPTSMASLFKKISSLEGNNNSKKLHPLFMERLLSSLIISKAEGIALEIKVGGGSFLKSQQQARSLASSIKSVCDQLNINTSFMLSNMNQPIGQAVGVTLEVREALDTLKGRGPLDFLKLALELGADMLLLSRKSMNRIEAKKILKKKLLNGGALNKFKEIIIAQKGNPRIIDDYSLLPQAKEKVKILSRKGGFIHRFLMERLHFVQLQLRINQNRPSDPISHGTGLIIFKKIGDRVEKGEVLAEVHLNGVENVYSIEREFRKIFIISEKPPDFQPLIIQKINE